MPEMNYGFAEVDGKPALVQPEHVNLGLAIDLAKPDGTPLAAGAATSRPPTTMDFAEFWSAYEDIVRRARGGKLDRRRLRRHHHQPHQPRHASAPCTRSRA